MNNHPSSQEPDFEMSPSERRAHSLATSASGKGKTSTTKTLASIVLGFELFVVFLVGLTMFGLGVFNPPWVGLAVGGGVCLLIIIALGVMRVKNFGVVLGWAIHLLYFFAGFFLVSTLIIAIIFTALWVFCIIKGRNIDLNRERLNQ